MALTKIIAVLVIALSSTLFIFGQNTSQFSFESEVGIAEYNSRDKVFCLIIPNKNLKKGKPVSLVLLSPYDKSQSAGMATIEQKLTVSCSLNPDAGNVFYSLKLISGSFKDYRLGFALISPTNKVQVKEGIARIDLDNDGESEFFRKCTSYEGLHLTVWSGDALKGKRRWHTYYYLGYDTEPTCTDEETADLEKADLD